MSRHWLAVGYSTSGIRITPGRRIGRLAEDYEASFLVLRGDPLEIWEMTDSIDLRIKNGLVIAPAGPDA